MVVNDGLTIFDAIGNWFDRRRAAKLARRKAKTAAQRKASAPKTRAPKRSTAKRVRRIRTAKDHRKAYGAPPALRVIPGGKA